MSSTGMAARLGIKPGDLILESGKRADADDALRSEIFTAAGSEPVGDGAQEVVDVVLLWWREDDGDLVDALVDSLTFLDAQGSFGYSLPRWAELGMLSRAISRRVRRPLGWRKLQHLLPVLIGARPN